MGAPTPRTALQRGNDTEERIQILEGRGGVPPRLTNNGRGTTAERDVYFGEIATTDQQVYLANLSPIWFNTDLGWEESFYVTTGTPGLTALGLLPSAYPGWYPTGRGPAATMYSAGSQSLSGAGSQFTNYQNFSASTPGVPPSSKNCTDDFIRYDVATGAALRVLLAGYYRIKGMLAGVSQTSSAAAMSLRVNTFDNVTTLYNQGYSVTTESPIVNYFTELDSAFLDVASMAQHRLDSGAVTVGYGTSFLSVEYLRPPLVSRLLT